MIVVPRTITTYPTLVNGDFCGNISLPEMRKIYALGVYLSTIS